MNHHCLCKYQGFNQAIVGIVKKRFSQMTQIFTDIILNKHLCTSVKPVS
jgi:hypothetical protein